MSIRGEYINHDADISNMQISFEAKINMLGSVQEYLFRIFPNETETSTSSYLT